MTDSHRTESITNAADDDGDLAVVALLAGDRPYCTGTLVSPQVVLTAGHCLYDVSPTAVYFGATPPVGGVVVPVRDSAIHPMFERSTLANDLGLLTLEAAPPATPLLLMPGSFGGSLDGMPVRLVGFGLDAALGGTGARKRSGTSLIASAYPTYFIVHPDPSQPCMGDSGAPALLTWGETEYLAGVVSAGDIACASFAKETRLEDSLTDFIQPYLDRARSEALRGEVLGGCSAAPGTPDSALPWIALLLLLHFRSPAFTLNNFSR